MLSAAVHAPLDVKEFIDEVVRCHTDMVETVHSLKVQMAVMDAQNRHLTNKVASLESKGASMEEMNNALTIRVALLEHIAEEQRIAHLTIASEKRADEKRAQEQRTQEQRAHEQRAQEQRAQEQRADDKSAEEKRIKDSCDALVRKNAKYPLHLAARDGECIEVLDYFLLKLHVDVNTQDKDGLTPLHWAARKGRNDAVNHLMNRGAEVDAKTGNGTSVGWTALWWAVSKGHTSTAQHLLLGGADVNAKVTFGATPLRRALMSGHHEVVALLKTNGGTM